MSQVILMSYSNFNWAYGTISKSFGKTEKQMVISYFLEMITVCNSNTLHATFIIECDPVEALAEGGYLLWG